MGGVTVVSSAGKSGFHEYGYRFMDTFAKHWPKDVDLVMYREGQETHPRARMRDLFDSLDCVQFLDGHKNNPIANGRLVEGDAAPTCWKNKDVTKGYSFRTDAVKFCRKVFAIADAAERLRSGLLVWIDADVVHLNDVPADFIERLLAGKDVAYLGRDNCHSECGFLAFRLPQALPLIRRWARFYTTDEVFLLSEWHDSFVFDECRRLTPEVSCRDMTPGGRRHVWASEKSPLRAYMDHCKGERKALGYSPEMRNPAFILEPDDEPVKRPKAPHPGFTKAEIARRAEEMRRLTAEGYSQKKIARILKSRTNTIRKAIRATPQVSDQMPKEEDLFFQLKGESA